MLPPSPQPGCGSCRAIFPCPQQTVPGKPPATQSGVPSQTQLTSFALVHAVAVGEQTEAPIPSGGTQQCSPRWQLMSLPPSPTPLKGQYGPTLASSAKTLPFGAL